jgi:hypothetical protein
MNYTPETENTRNVVEAVNIGSSDVSTIYRLDTTSENAILTIPQASESGWLAVSIKGNQLQILDSKVVVNGWKQGWDISNIDYDSIYVIYYPNLLGYIGYGILIAEFLILMLNLLPFRKWKSR